MRLGRRAVRIDRAGRQVELDDGATLEYDALLLATDLEKSIRQLELAYDDPLGVTAAFNLNILAAINRDPLAVVGRLRPKFEFDPELENKFRVSF